ncbi:MAG: hypothetical protein JWP59_206 [Massilia sp.]|jgi:hypothetical protein|nr:hypothetical protein [Massilia sp.]
MYFDWKINGFRHRPAAHLASGSEKLYRAWGGHPGRKWGNKFMAGVCFSLDRAWSRVEAEKLYSVMEYQNPVHFITEFSIDKNTPIWIGKVDPGDPRAMLGRTSGSQVLVERSNLRFVHEGLTSQLRDNLSPFWLYTGKLSDLSC